MFRRNHSVCNHSAICKIILLSQINPTGRQFSIFYIIPVTIFQIPSVFLLFHDHFLMTILVKNICFAVNVSCTDRHGSIVFKIISSTDPLVFQYFSICICIIPFQIKKCPVVGNECSTVVCNIVLILFSIPFINPSGFHFTVFGEFVFLSANFSDFIFCCGSICFYIIPVIIFCFPSGRHINGTSRICVQCFVNPVTILFVTCIKYTSLHLTIQVNIIFCSF